MIVISVLFRKEWNRRNKLICPKMSRTGRVGAGREVGGWGVWRGGWGGREEGVGDDQPPFPILPTPHM